MVIVIIIVVLYAWQLPKMSSQINNNKRKKSNTTLPTGKKANRPKNFSPFEDQCLCRAYVNVSCNSIKGNDQKREGFWGSIKQKFDELYQAEKVDLDDIKVERAAESLMYRYQRIIQLEVNLWNPYY